MKKKSLKVILYVYIASLCLKIILWILPQCHKFKFKNYKHCMWKILSIFLLIRVCCHLASVSAFWKYCSRKNAAHFGSTKPGKTPASAHAGPISPFLFFRVQYFQNAFWKYCSRKNRASAPHSRWPNFTIFYFSGYSTSIYSAFWKYCSRKNSQRLSRASAPHSRWPNITFFYFSGYSTSIFLFFRSTESPGKTRSVFTPPDVPCYFVGLYPPSQLNN